MSCKLNQQESLNKIDNNETDLRDASPDLPAKDSDKMMNLPNRILDKMQKEKYYSINIIRKTFKK